MQSVQNRSQTNENPYFQSANIYILEVQGALWARLHVGGFLTSSFVPNGHSGRMTHPSVIGQCISLWIVCQPLDSVLTFGQCVQPLDIVLVFGQCVSLWIACQPLNSVLAVGQCVSRWIVCQPLDFSVTQQQDNPVLGVRISHVGTPPHTPHIFVNLLQIGQKYHRLRLGYLYTSRMSLKPFHVLKWHVVNC